MSKKPEGTKWAQVLALYEETVARTTPSFSGKVRVAGDRPQLVEARSIRVIEGTTQPAEQGSKYLGLIETDAHLGPLPVGCEVGRCCVTVDQAGRVPVQVINFGCEDIYLEPRTVLATLEEVNIEPQITLQTVSCGEVRVQTKDLSSGDSSQVEQFLSRMDVDTELSQDERQTLKALIQKHVGVFSKDEDDIGFCDDVKHHI